MARRKRTTKPEAQTDIPFEESHAPEAQSDELRVFPHQLRAGDLRDRGRTRVGASRSACRSREIECEGGPQDVLHSSTFSLAACCCRRCLRRHQCCAVNIPRLANASHSRSPRSPAESGCAGHSGSPRSPAQSGRAGTSGRVRCQARAEFPVVLDNIARHLDRCSGRHCRHYGADSGVSPPGQVGDTLQLRPSRVVRDGDGRLVYRLTLPCDPVADPAYLKALVAGEQVSAIACERSGSAQVFYARSLDELRAWAEEARKGRL
jgi:hypothetical protein